MRLPKAVKFHSVDKPRHAHFVGIGGSGMRALASVLAEQGWSVSGSDLRPASTKRLSARGICIRRGHASDHVPANARLLVYSDAIPVENPERGRAEHLHIESLSYAQLLGRLTGNQRTLAVAGTHGKSTVTAMTAEILVRAGLDPTVICGAAPIRSSDSSIGAVGGRNGNGSLALVEACEYRENFLQLKPSVAVLLNIEPDHFDYYRTNEQLTTAFTRFAQQVPEDGLILAGHESPTAQQIALTSGRHVVTFGLQSEAHWRATNLEQSRGRYRFDLVRHGRRMSRIVLSVPGKHQVLNALAAAALARHCGVSVQQISQGLAAFRGLKRRLEPRGTWNGATWIDDYAHHPTEVKASLATVRQMFPRRRICCVFQPHQASRLTALLDETAASLHNADRIAVANVFRAREAAPQPGEATAADLSARLFASGLDVAAEHDPALIARQLASELGPTDVLVTMGAGDLGKIFDEFNERVRRNRAVA
jgi:UDP-N-acetylmuramate--alanine ligase